MTYRPGSVRLTPNGSTTCPPPACWQTAHVKGVCESSSECPQAPTALPGARRTVPCLRSASCRPQRTAPTDPPGSTPNGRGQPVPTLSYVVDDRSGAAFPECRCVLWRGTSREAGASRFNAQALQGRKAGTSPAGTSQRRCIPTMARSPKAGERRPSRPSCSASAWSHAPLADRSRWDGDRRAGANGVAEGLCAHLKAHLRVTQSLA